MTKIRDAMTPEQFARVEQDGHGRWSQTELLIATLNDRVAELTWLYSSVHAPKGVKPKRPKPIPRPGVGAQRRIQPLEERLAAVDERTRKVAELMRAGKPVPPELL
jgi:hypothetical protein